MPSAPTVFFYCNAVGEDLIAERGIRSDSPAATRKVAAVCTALKTGGVRALVVSMGRGRTGGEPKAFGPRCGRMGRVPVVYGPLRTGELTSLLATVLWLCALAWRLGRRKNAVHLFYNQLVLYLPALAVLRVLSARTALDLEDGPIGEFNPNHRGNAPAWLFACFINSGALVACRVLAGATTVRPTLPIYGAIPASSGPNPPNRGDRLEVLYSGSIDRATGSDMLAEAIRLLRASEAGRNIRIHVTGAGGGLQALEALTNSDKGPEVKVHGRLPLVEYARLLSTCSVGLSLKLGSGPFAQTTFPSKTIEYAEHDLMLITTDVSDVRALFQGAALYIRDDSATALAGHLLWSAEHREERDELIRAARVRLTETVSQEAVGAALKAFFFGGAQS